MISSVRKALLAVFTVSLVLCLLMIGLYETELLISGDMQGDKILEYYVVAFMELVTICSIPLALRLFKFGFVRRAIAQSPSRGLTRWGIIRLLLICLPMIANTFLYYQFMNVALGYMAIIDLLCLVFVYPSESRCQQELEIKV